MSKEIVGSKVGIGVKLVAGDVLDIISGGNDSRNYTLVLRAGVHTVIGTAAVSRKQLKKLRKALKRLLRSTKAQGMAAMLAHSGK